MRWAATCQSSLGGRQVCQMKKLYGGIERLVD